MTKSVSPKGPAYIAINHITHRGPPLSPFFFLSFVLSFLTPLGALIRNNARVFFHCVCVTRVRTCVLLCKSYTQITGFWFWFQVASEQIWLRLSRHRSCLSFFNTSPFIFRFYLLFIFPGSPMRTAPPHYFQI